MILVLITPYEIKMGIYKDMKQYAKALETLEECDSLREVSRSEGIKKEMAEMQARFNVYSLQLEKEKLTNRNNVVIITVTVYHRVDHLSTFDGEAIEACAGRFGEIERRDSHTA